MSPDDITEHTLLCVGCKDTTYEQNEDLFGDSVSKDIRIHALAQVLSQCGSQHVPAPGGDTLKGGVRLMGVAVENSLVPSITHFASLEIDDQQAEEKSLVEKAMPQARLHYRYWLEKQVERVNQFIDIDSRKGSQ